MVGEHEMEMSSASARLGDQREHNEIDRYRRTVKWIIGAFAAVTLTFGTWCGTTIVSLSSEVATMKESIDGSVRSEIDANKEHTQDLIDALLRETDIRINLLLELIKQVDQ